MTYSNASARSDFVDDVIVRSNCKVFNYLLNKFDISWQPFDAAFCSEKGARGKVFRIVFNIDDKPNFALSQLVVGAGIVVVKPQLEGVWIGMRVFSTPEPCLPGQPNWTAFVPQPFPDNVSDIQYFRNWRTFQARSCYYIILTHRESIADMLNGWH